MGESQELFQMSVTKHFRSYICEECKLQCDIEGAAALSGRVLVCPDCPTRARMVPQGPCWPAVESPIGVIGSRGTVLEILTTLTNAIIDMKTAVEGVKEHLDRRWDPRDPEIW